MTIYNLFSLIAGLAFFLFGMNIMSSYLEKMAGGRLESILKKLTSNPLKSLALGAGITIAIQSSSALTVMLVGLVNSGITEFSSTVHVIMGSDIGTTLTAWILSLNGISSDNILISMLKPQNFSSIVAIVGVVMIMSGKKQKTKDIGTIFCGFSVLMFGMTLMSDSVKPLASIPEFRNLLVAFDNPFLDLLIGIAFTGVIQASAASIGVLQALSLTGSITFGMAMPIVMGANIGTCVTAILSGFGVSKKAKRVPTLHIIIKIIGALLWMGVYLVMRYILKLGFFDQVISPFEIAVFHTVFNIGTILVLLPFSNKLVKLVKRIINITEPIAVERPKVLLDERLMLSTGLAVAQCRNKTVDMALLAKAAFTDALAVFDHYDPDAVEHVISMEQELDYMEDQLDTFLIRLSSRELTDSDSELVSEMLHTINDFERIGDHAINMTMLAKQMNEQGLKFSKAARKELSILTSALVEILNLTMGSFEDNDEKLARCIEPLEEVIDDLTKEIKNRHIDRLKHGECAVELGIILNDYITNCERVSDHCSNVGIAIIQTSNSTFEVHGYLNEMKRGEESEFLKRFENYQMVYALPKLERRKRHREWTETAEVSVQ